jgi:hypothetical protein
MVIKKFREIDPNFQMEPFLREMRDYMLPEVLDAPELFDDHGGLVFGEEASNAIGDAACCAD